jgi:FixJ family two-component response regulator
VIMPDLNGRELHAEAARRHRHVKVVFISGYADGRPI